jgi:formiminotetrahydrofolate cyclodeaminase
VRLADQSLDAIMRMMSHPSPELGGSTAAMLSGHIGLSMIRMALAVTGQSETHETGPALAEIGRIAEKLAESADRDRRAFETYLDRVKAHPEPGSAAEERLAAAENDTFRELMAGAALLVDGLEAAAGLAGRVRKSVESDLYGGAALIDAAFAGVSLAVQTNLRPERMQNRRADILAMLDALHAKRKKAYGELVRGAEAGGFRT